jgi:hypothetical protein
LDAVITCNVHARELFTGEVCVEFIRRIGLANDEETKLIADHINFRIFYVGN